MAGAQGPAMKHMPGMRKGGRWRTAWVAHHTHGHTRLRRSTLARHPTMSPAVESEGGVLAQLIA